MLQQVLLELLIGHSLCKEVFEEMNAENVNRYSFFN